MAYEIIAVRISTGGSLEIYFPKKPERTEGKLDKLIQDGWTLIFPEREMLRSNLAFFTGKAPPIRSKEYLAKLRDPRWQERRQQILTRDEFRCADNLDSRLEKPEKQHTQPK